MSISSQEAEGDEDEVLSDGLSSSSSDHPSPPRPFSQNYFAPPFYGRPPTPLPPSPSLTSLLRPSRPTTPDASEDDHHHNNNTTTNNSSSNVAPLPHTAPQVPTYEYYGFVLYLFSCLAFLAYLLWSYLPTPFLHALGIYYYPERWWALAVPSFLVMTLCYIYVALAAYNTEILTVPMGSVETIVDGAGKMADGRGRKSGGKWKDLWGEGTDAVMDVPLGGVCEVLYGDEREDSEREEDLG